MRWMDISALIETLEALRKKHGELWVEYPNGQLVNADEITARVLEIPDIGRMEAKIVLQLGLPRCIWFDDEQQKEKENG